MAEEITLENLKKGLVEIHKQVVALHKKIDSLGLPGQPRVDSALVGHIGDAINGKSTFFPVTFLVGADDEEVKVNIFDTKIVDKLEELQQAGKSFELTLQKTTDGKFWNFKQLTVDGQTFKPERSKPKSGGGSSASGGGDDYVPF